MVNVPKERKTYCKNKKCRKHQVHKVTQYKAGKAELCAGQRRSTARMGFGGQTKPVFHKKAKTTKRSSSGSSARRQGQEAAQDQACKHFELGEKKKATAHP